MGHAQKYIQIFGYFFRLKKNFLFEDINVEVEENKTHWNLIAIFMGFYLVFSLVFHFDKLRCECRKIKKCKGCVVSVSVLRKRIQRSLHIRIHQFDGILRMEHYEIFYY